MSFNASEPVFVALRLRPRQHRLHVVVGGCFSAGDHGADLNYVGANFVDTDRSDFFCSFLGSSEELKKPARRHADKLRSDQCINSSLIVEPLTKHEFLRSYSFKRVFAFLLGTRLHTQVLLCTFLLSSCSYFDLNPKDSKT